jgi:ATP-dependent Zn protease
MKKIIVLLSVFSLVFTSCSDSDGNNNSLQDVLLTKAINTYEDGTVETFHYNYNGNKLTGQTFDDGHSEVTYTGNLIQKIESFYLNDLVQRSTYEYDNNQRLIGFVRDEYYDDNHYTTRATYVYGNGTTVGFTILSGNIDYPLYEKTGTMNLNASGEVISITDSYNTVKTITYDDKKSPHLNVIGVNKIHFQEDDVNAMLHNILLEESDYGTTTNTYTYNANGFPKTQVQNDGHEIITTEYFYNIDN